MDTRSASSSSSGSSSEDDEVSDLELTRPKVNMDAMTTNSEKRRAARLMKNWTKKKKLKDELTSNLYSQKNVNLIMYFDNPFSKKAGIMQVGLGSPISDAP